jgi:hypothetical protein
MRIGLLVPGFQAISVSMKQQGDYKNSGGSRGQTEENRIPFRKVI